MLRDIAFAVVCVATFALAIAYLASSSRDRSERDGVRIARMEAELASLHRHFDDLQTAVDEARAAAPAPEAAASSTKLEGAAPERRAPVPAAGSSDLGQVLSRLDPGNDSVTRASAARQLLASQGDDVRLFAARTLLEVDVQQGLDAVAQLVATTKQQSQTMPTALRAVSLVAGVKDRSADAALRRYADDSSPLVRLHAAKLLAQRGDSEPMGRAVDDLIRELDSADHRQRLQSLALLGMASQPSTIPRIVPFLRDSNSEIRNRAARTLGQFKDPSVRSSLAPLLNDPVPEVRTTAALALQGIR